METINAQIVSFRNTNVFVYNGNTVRVQPTSVDDISMMVTTIIPDDVVVERSTMDDLLTEYNALGFSLQEEIGQIENNVEDI
jgi:hypothetical protein